MKETQQELAKLSLGDAVNEQKTLLAKLQRLQDLLMSSDLDFQLRLELRHHAPRFCDGWTPRSRKKIARRKLLTKPPRKKKNSPG